MSASIADRASRPAHHHGARHAARSSVSLRAASASLVALLCAATALPALAEPAGADCPGASLEGQRARDKNRYAEARELFRSCSEKSCPAVVKRNCVKWLADLDEAQPTIVIAAQDEGGKDLVDVRVLLDDAEVATRVDGSPLPVDPGEHTLRVEAEGREANTQRLVIRVNEKNRLVRVVFEDGRAAATEGPPPPASVTAEPPSNAGFPVLAATLGGVSLLGFASFGYFGATASDDLSTLRSTCAPACATADLDSVKNRMLVADISLGVGIVALGAAVILYLTHGSGSATEQASARRALTSKR